VLTASARTCCALIFNSGWQVGVTTDEIWHRVALLSNETYLYESQGFRERYSVCLTKKLYEQYTTRGLYTTSSVV
jgi:hypothetical protein